MNKAGILRVAKSVAFELFGANACRLAMAAHQEGRSSDTLPPRANSAYKWLKVLNGFVPLASLMKQQEKAEIERSQVYDQHLLNLMVNRAYDLPAVEVDNDAPKRINVLVPAFTVSTISAGFFGVFNVAIFIAKLGYRVRLVLFDNFYYVEDEFRQALNKFPSMENLFDQLEVEYIGARDRALAVSPSDNCVATVWYSAYFAEKISSATGNAPFLYLIQDYEAAFHPFNSQYCIARNSYDFRFHTLASSASLLDYLFSNGIVSRSADLKAISFNNACSSSIYSASEFLQRKRSRKKKFVFYSRPAVNRNMFELAALSLIDAFAKGAFASGDWEFYGMGIGNATVQLAEGVEVKQLPRMSLAEYEEVTKTFDLCLTLMSSPHPSLIPMDLAASGAIVVTNTFETKTSEFLREISGNIIAAEPDLSSLSDAIANGVRRADDLEARYKNAQISWPSTWDETWSDSHKDFIREVFGSVN